MADAPTEAPTAAPEAPASVEKPTNTEPAQAPEAPKIDLGLSEEQAQKFKTFIENSGGFDNAFKKLKTDVSSPQEPVEPPQSHSESKNDNQPTSQPIPPVEAPYKAPEGSITAQEFLAQQYFQGLSRDPKYEGIADQISSGDVLKEMAAFNIQALNQDGSINDGMVRKFLDLKAQTVPAKPTGTEPDASAAPTANYVEVGDQITSLDQAYQVIMQPNHPAMSKAEEYIKAHLNPNSQKKS